MNPIIEQTPYGTNSVGLPYREADGQFIRLDTWTGKAGSSALERRFALNRQDLSPVARDRGMFGLSGNCDYHPKCSCCWLGFSHTLALHNHEAVGEW